MQGVVLTGGASRRMGADKAAWPVAGVPMAVGVARALREAGLEVWVLGREPLEGFAFLADREHHRGPLAALRSFQPAGAWTFVASCDMPLFRREVASALAGLQAPQVDAVLPVVAGREQFLCGWYAARAFEALAAHPEWTRMADWIATLRVERADEPVLDRLGIDQGWVCGVNAPEDLRRLAGG